MPDPVQFALDCERFGADGITVHPRPDARHVRPDDVRALRQSLSTELNVEGNPLESYYMDLVLEVRPAQATLVPDHPLQRTSDHGWDLDQDGERLRPLIAKLNAAGIRVSLFIDPNPRHAEQAAELGTQAVEFTPKALPVVMIQKTRRRTAPHPTRPPTTEHWIVACW